MFDSSPAPPVGKVEAKHIIDALAIDPMVAGDSWVRFAKTRFKELMDVLNARRVDELSGAAHPLWTKQESVCISIHDRDTRSEAASLITWAVDDLAHCIMQLLTKYGAESGRGELVLVGALVVKAHDLGGGFFNFVVKQQFTAGSYES